MPQEEPGTCVGEEAESVAAFIHDAFYSKIAQARNKPPRIDLARLTVRQYRNVVADLIGSFKEPIKWDDAQHGLKAEYFKSKRNRGDAVLSRIDPEVHFNFKLESPDPKIDPKEFTIQWRGALLAPETGEYELIIRTENSFRFFLNDPRKPLIDATVKSGKDTEYRASMRLLAGRPYPIRLEYTKGKAGVEDSKEKKAKAPIEPGSISLEWKQPNLPVEVIASRYLSPVNVPESFVLETAFPPDDRSIGYERGTTVSKAWDQATTDAAIEVSAYISSRLPQIAGVADNATDRATKLKDFVGKFAERAFRRPLDDVQKHRYVNRHFEALKDPELATKRAILLILKSPRFLYDEVAEGKPDAFDVASRISFGIWDSIPDQTLYEAARQGKLSTREQIVKQVERMMPDVRTHSKLRRFFLQWVNVEQVPDLSKDSKLYPGFDKAVLADLRTSLDLFLNDVVWSDSSDFRELLLNDSVYLNGRLAKLYGADLPADAPFKKVQIDGRARAGVFSHPYLMSTFAYTATSSPIHRGVFVARSVLGRSLPAPPAAVAPLAPDLHPGLTTRERVVVQTKPAFCASCHTMINPLGFSMENFDSIGRFRKEEKGKPIDASGTYEDPSGKVTKYSGARELATLIAKSEESHDAFIEQLFHEVVKQPIRAYGPNELTSLRSSFASQNYHIRKLLVEILATTALTPRDSSPKVAIQTAPGSRIEAHSTSSPRSENHGK
jgi:hypothetical protein